MNNQETYLDWIKNEKVLNPVLTFEEAMNNNLLRKRLKFLRPKETRFSTLARLLQPSV